MSDLDPAGGLEFGVVGNRCSLFAQRLPKLSAAGCGIEMAIDSFAGQCGFAPRALCVKGLRIGKTSNLTSL